MTQQFNIMKYNRKRNKHYKTQKINAGYKLAELSKLKFVTPDFSI